MVEALKDKINAVTKIQEVSEMVDDPIWIRNNNEKLYVEAKISKMRWECDTAKKAVEELADKRAGITARMLKEENQLYKVEKSWGGIGKWLFSKDIQKRKEIMVDLFNKWSVFDEEIKEANKIVENYEKTIPYLVEQNNELIRKEHDIIQSYRQKSGLENNIDKSVTDRRVGTVERTENNIDKSVANRRAGTVERTENELNKISNIRKQGVINKQSNQQPTNNSRKVGGDRSI